MGPTHFTGAELRSARPPHSEDEGRNSVDLDYSSSIAYIYSFIQSSWGADKNEKTHLRNSQIYGLILKDEDEDDDSSQEDLTEEEEPKQKGRKGASTPASKRFPVDLYGPVTPPSPFEAPLERLGLADADEDEQEEEEVRPFK